MTNAIRVLSESLCPWLQAPFAVLEEARQQGRLGHAWLLTGSWGIGKINLALVLAERLLNPSGTDPLVLTASAATAARAELYEPADHRPDLVCVFPQDQRRSIGIDQIREACQQLTLSSLQGQAKVMVVEPAESLTTAAANALLKTLEEPTPNTYIWLVSHQPGRLPATVRSRCQKMSIPRPLPAQVHAWLEASGKSASEAPWPADSMTLAPFEILDRARLPKAISNNAIYDTLHKISISEIDAQAVADQWLKDDSALWMQGIATVLQATLRGCLAPAASNRVTDSAPDRLHTLGLGLTPRQLFGKLTEVENLLASRGSGINDGLALRVILLGFLSAEHQPR